MSFHAPTDKTPLLPPANVEQVTQVTSPFPSIDLYNVSPPLAGGGTQINVPAGTSMDQVLKHAAAASSMAKILYPPYCDVGDNMLPFVVMTAQRWWVTNILPAYGITH